MNWCEEAIPISHGQLMNRQAESHEEPLTWREEVIPKHNPQYPMSVVMRGRAPSTPGGLAESKQIMAISERNLRIDLQSEDC